MPTSDRLLCGLQMLPVAGCSTAQEVRALTNRSGKAEDETDRFSMFCGRFRVPIERWRPAWRCGTPLASVKKSWSRVE
jgi:hypothetical protein